MSMLITIFICVMIATIFDNLLSDDRPSYKEKRRRINRNENDTILDRRDS